MAYDRDSFLSGLAVGRVLWRPPIVVPDVGTLMVVSAFPTGEFIDLNWSATRAGVSYDCIKFKLSVRRYEMQHPTPIYWFLEKISSVEVRAVLFTPDEEIDTWPSGFEYWCSVTGETEDGQTVLDRDISFYWSSAIDGRYIKRTIAIPIRQSSPGASDLWQSFIEEGYLGWDSSGSIPHAGLSFSKSAMLVESEDALYLVGVQDAN